MLFNVSFIKPLPSGVRRAEIRAQDFADLGRILRQRYPKQRPNSVTHNGNSIVLSNIPDDLWYENREDYFVSLGWKRHSEPNPVFEVGKTYIYAPRWCGLAEIKLDSILEVTCVESIPEEKGPTYRFLSGHGIHFNKARDRDTGSFIRSYTIYNQGFEDELAPIEALVHDYFLQHYYYHNLLVVTDHHHAVSKQILEILDYVKTKFGYVPSFCIRDNYIPDVTLVKE